VLPEHLVWRQQAFVRFSSAVELPMLILTVLMIPVLIIPYAVHHLSPATQSLLDGADYFIWGIFLIEYLITVNLAPRRWHFVVHNIPDLVIVAVPMLRPLRIIRSVRVLRALRLSRLTAVAGEGTQKAKRSLHSRATNYVLVVMGSLILVCSIVVLDMERQAKGANIKTFGDALWWAVTTVYHRWIRGSLPGHRWRESGGHGAHDRRDRSARRGDRRRGRVLRGAEPGHQDSREGRRGVAEEA
jgi:voltage-gated potassium channel